MNRHLIQGKVLFFRVAGDGGGGINKKGEASAIAVASPFLL